MDLNELYKEIEEAEVSLNAKRLKYIKEALVENGVGKSRKDYEKFLNSISPDRDDEAWIIGGKNRYCGRENYGTMIKRHDPIGFSVGYREWAEQPE